MKFFICVLCMAVVLSLPFDLNAQAISKSNSLKEQYDEVMVNATSDATKQLIYAKDSYSLETMADGDKLNFQTVNLNLDKSLDRFYKTLWINLGIENDKVAQQSMLYKLPIILVTGYDGYYINYWNSNGRGKEWSKKTLYSTVDEEDKLVVNFTLDDYVTVKDLQTREVFRGTRDQLKSRFPHSFLADKDKFEKYKATTINKLIKKDLEYYTYNANAVAKKFSWGITYDIPYWGDRSIDTIAFMTFIQGQVFSGQDSFDSYGFATSRIKKNRAVYGYVLNGKKLYSHNKIGTKPTYFANQFEAATHGYSPDERYMK